MFDNFGLKVFDCQQIAIENKLQATQVLLARKANTFFAIQVN